MARLDDLMDFARAHGLKIGTIRDLIAYRLKKDHLVEKVATAPFTASSGAQWQAQVFRDKASGEEQLALVHGALDPTQPVLVRMHSLDLFADVHRRIVPRSGMLQGAMRMIEEEGSGVVVALHAAAPGSLSRSIDLRAGKPVEGGDAVRGYGTGAQILAALGIHDMILLSNTQPCAGRPVGLRPGDRRGTRRSRRSAEAVDLPPGRGALLPAPQRHAACRRPRARSRRPATSMRR